MACCTDLDDGSEDQAKVVMQLLVARRGCRRKESKLDARLEGNVKELRTRPPTGRHGPAQQKFALGVQNTALYSDMD